MQSFAYHPVYSLPILGSEGITMTKSEQRRAAKLQASLIAQGIAQQPQEATQATEPATVTVDTNTAANAVIVRLYPDSVVTEGFKEKAFPVAAEYAVLAGYAADNADPTEVQYMAFRDGVKNAGMFGPFNRRQGMKGNFQDALKKLFPAMTFDVTPAHKFDVVDSNAWKTLRQIKTVIRLNAAKTAPPVAQEEVTTPTDAPQEVTAE
jgi:hypothetical protein